ncbi:hypothetical protein LV83_03712 [Algoriphagus yeomjeoni]|uniref:Uncharacterized protein n=1 Tax=Algoriphagus yeomjeoni TaxID=291403 RepID=A0A327P236_9BACT|nr:hypothetical protein LV83_03712 [Algoriphagus yeomjeoni]
MIIRYSASKENYKSKIWYSVFKSHNIMVSSVPIAMRESKTIHDPVRSAG